MMLHGNKLLFIFGNFPHSKAKVFGLCQQLRVCRYENKLPKMKSGFMLPSSNIVLCLEFYYECFYYLVIVARHAFNAFTSICTISASTVGKFFGRKIVLGQIQIHCHTQEDIYFNW